MKLSNSFPTNVPSNSQAKFISIASSRFSQIISNTRLENRNRLVFSRIIRFHYNCFNILTHIRILSIELTHIYSDCRNRKVSNIFWMCAGGGALSQTLNRLLTTCIGQNAHNKFWFFFACDFLYLINSCEILEIFLEIRQTISRRNYLHISARNIRLPKWIWFQCDEYFMEIL